MQKRFVDTPQALEELCTDLSGSPWLALDTEFIRERTYYPQLCLLQVANERISACVDPLALDDLQPLLDLIYDSAAIKVFHAARQDMEIFLHRWNRLPEPVFDTQPAAALLGHGEQIGYANLVRTLLDHDLAKDQSRTDWSRRPLGQAQLDYAHDDVIFLGEMYPRLREKLAEQGRLGWLEAEQTELADPQTYFLPVDTLWQKVKGRQKLRGVQLAILRALAAWREEQARERDRPRKWILKDEVLLDLAKRRMQNRGDLEQVRGLEPKTIERHGDRLLSLIAEASALPREQWPADDKRGRQLSQNQDAMADLLSAALRLLCAPLKLTPTAVATRRDLEQLVLRDPACPLLHGWRREAVGEKLVAVRDGQRILRVTDQGLRLD